MASILVVDGAATVRETLRIVLGTEHEVVTAASFDGLPPHAPRPDVVVVGLPPLARERHAFEAALGERAWGVPLLLLESAGDVEVQRLVPPHVPLEYLPKPFDAPGVRRAIRSLLRRGASTPIAKGADASHRRHLEAPFLPRAAAALVRNVLATDVRVVGLRGEVGTGAPRIARALHAARGARGAYVAVDAARLPVGALDRRLADAGGLAGATVFVANLDGADRLVQADVAVAVERARDENGALVVASFAGDLAEAVADDRSAAELAYAVTTVLVELTPLRDRMEDVPALVASITSDLCDRLRLEPPTWEPAAIERLQQYLWFGNLVELEAVIARTLVVHRPSTIGAAAILFLPEATPGAMAEHLGRAEPVARPAASGDGVGGLDLEVVLGELAHELRNPMVTIKTFAQHLDSVLADPEVRARFATLTSEAIGRMDDLLETLLDFARFRTPAVRPVDVQVLMDRALGEYAAELQRRHVDVERNGVGSAPVDVDEAQVLFAFRSLCRGLVPDLTAHTVLKVRGAERGVELQMRTEPSTAARLSTWVDGERRDDGETPPLMWALAASLLARNGAALTVRKGESDSTVIRVEWPARV